MDKDIKIGKVILRLIVSPFIFGLVLTALTIEITRRMYLFFLYGGEYITYEKGDKQTIKDIYKELKLTSQTDSKDNY